MEKDRIIDRVDFDPNHVIAGVDEIRRFNPQRYEMEQLTAIVHEDTERGICIGYKEVTREEFWVRAHMPGMPLMPGVLMLEAAAQLSSYFVQKYDMMKAKMVGFGGLEDVRFRDPVVPGERLWLAVQMLKARPRRMLICRFQGYVRDQLVVEGKIKGIPLPLDAVAAAQD